MKFKQIKINKACTENWDKMSVSEQGKFCSVCAKNVIDFSQSSPEEIIDIIESSKGEICGRMTSSQLNKPIIEYKEYKEYKLPYSRKIAASLFLAASLSSVQANDFVSKKQTFLHPIALSSKLNEILKTDTASDISQGEKKIETILFKGKVVNNNLGHLSDELAKNEERAIANALIEFITLDKVYSTYSDKNGEYSLEIPKEVIDEENLVIFSFDKIVRTKLENKEISFSIKNYEMKKIILKKDEITQDYLYKAMPELMILGGMMFDDYYEITPTIYINGVKIDYEKEYIKMINNKKERKLLSEKISYHFTPKQASAITGLKAKDELYLYFDKE